MAMSGAERQAAFKARRGRQVSVPLSDGARAALGDRAREWGLSQRDALERLLTQPIVVPAAAPPVLSAEHYLLRQDYARLEHDYRMAREEIRRLEASLNRALIAKIAAERAVTGNSETSARVMRRPQSTPLKSQAGEKL